MYTAAPGPARSRHDTWPWSEGKPRDWWAGRLWSAQWQLGPSTCCAIHRRRSAESEAVVSINGAQSLDACWEIRQPPHQGSLRRKIFVNFDTMPFAHRHVYVNDLTLYVSGDSRDLKQNSRGRRRQRRQKKKVRDDVTLFLVTSKRDLVEKISREFKRNIVSIEHVCWKFYKMKKRQ